VSTKIYDFIVVGAGISGCSIAFELSKSSKSILLIDKNNDVASGASGAAGAFLSPLLGKPNKFKDLITKSLIYSTNFYLKHTPNCIDQCGTVRIPKDDIHKQKFETYKQYMDFEYTIKDDGYYFKIASVVDGYEVCKILSKDIEKLLNYDVHTIKYVDKIWNINDTYKAKNIIITTGANTKLIKEDYFNIRAVWGQKITINTTTKLNINYHKECSISKSKKVNDSYNVSIGATHHRLLEQKEIDKNNIDTFTMSKELCTQCANVCISDNDTNDLLQKASDIINLENIKLIDAKAGARACSVDYFPIVGSLIDSSKTIEEFPYLINGTNVQDDRFTKIENLYIINGVGGRGYVLAPFLAKQLYNHIIKDEKLYDIITPNRLFKRWVKKRRKS